jgi:hypothetical protein
MLTVALNVTEQGMEEKNENFIFWNRDIFGTYSFSCSYYGGLAVAGALCSKESGYTMERENTFLFCIIYGGYKFSIFCNLLCLTQDIVGVIFNVALGVAE